MILVMPIYQGGNLFLEGLDSVERADIPFNKIVISFNGASAADYNLFCREKSRGRFRKEYTILRSNCELNSLNHSIFIANYLKTIYVNSLQLFFLAHDDRILTSSDSKKSHKYLMNASPDTIYFPSYSCCNAKDYSNIFEVIESDNVMSSNEFFWLTQRQNVPTSMSGMIVSLDAWSETLTILKKSGSGARFEHLLCIASSINYVRFSTNVRVLVAQRKNSEADNLNARQHRIASLYYTLTFFKNRRIVSTLEFILYCWILFKKIIGVLIQYKK